MYKNYPKERYNNTINFLQDSISPPARILDLGVVNPFTEVMKQNGYEVYNTGGEDLDIKYDSVKNIEVDIVTAFEIFEHLVAPFNILREIKTSKLVATIPLCLWFATAYRSKTDVWDRHYHEFEDWQFDWLLEKAGWKIQKTEKWISHNKKIGIRPFLRNITPRYYAVYATRC